MLGKYLNENELVIFKALITRKGIKQERIGQIIRPEKPLTQEAVSRRFVRKKFPRLEAREVLKVLKEEEKGFIEVNF